MFDLKNIFSPPLVSSQFFFVNIKGSDSSLTCTILWNTVTNLHFNCYHLCKVKILAFS